MEAATALDDAKGRLQAAADPEPKARKQDPSYHVFEETAENVFRMLTTTTGERASSRKAAVRQVAKTPPDKVHDPHTYLVIAAKEFQLLTRHVKATVEETFE